MRQTPSNTRLLEVFTPAMLAALEAVHANHAKLGESGKEFSAKNSFGENGLRADVEAERIVLEHLERLQASNANISAILVHSEEHGSFRIGQGEIVATVYLDGIDGTSDYINAGGVGHGTMVAVAFENNPKYRDVSFSAFMRLDTGELLFRSDGGLPIINNLVAKSSALIVPKIVTVDLLHQHIFTDGCYSELVKDMINARLIKAGITPRHTLTTAGNLFHILTGRKIVFEGLPQVAIAIFEEFDKGCLEMAAMRYLIAGIGGVMLALTPEGGAREIGEDHISDLGHDPGTLFIVAASRPIADALLAIINA